MFNRPKHAAAVKRIAAAARRLDFAVHNEAHSMIFDAHFESHTAEMLKIGARLRQDADTLARLAREIAPAPRKAAR